MGISNNVVASFAFTVIIFEFCIVRNPIPASIHSSSERIYSFTRAGSSIW